LTVRDIQDAADLFSGVYQKTRGLDGYVSLEVNPKLAYNAHRTVEEARRLYEKVNRPNLMLKVPATDEGFKAVSKLTSLGLNVNVTLIFSLEQYISTAQAYIEGISRLIEGGGQPGTVRSVASVFVSRIDSVVDKMLDKELKEHKDHKTIAELTSLKGTAAVANSQIIYGKFIEMFSDEKFTKLKKRGANSQRVLWGSTSTKNPIYSDVKYVTDLIGRDTVNTIPENTLLAFLDHGEVKEALTTGTSSAEDTIRDLKSFGIDVNRICMKLLEDGIASFEKSFDSLLETIEKKSERLQV